MKAFWVLTVLATLYVLPQASFGIPMEPASPALNESELFSSTNLLQTDPITSLRNLAEARFQQGLWQDAAEYAKNLMNREPQDLSAHGILGSVYALTGQRDLASKEMTFLKDAKDSGFYLNLMKAVLSAQEGR